MKYGLGEAARAAGGGVQGGVGWLHRRAEELGQADEQEVRIKEAPDWWSEELASWASNQRIYGRAFKKHASERSKTEKTYAGRTPRRRVALLDGIGFFT